MMIRRLLAVFVLTPSIAPALSCQFPEPAHIPAGTPAAEAKQIEIAHAYNYAVSPAVGKMIAYGVVSKKYDGLFQHEWPLDIDALDGERLINASEMFYDGALTFSGVQFQNGQAIPLELDYLSFRVRFEGGGGSMIPAFDTPILAELTADTPFSPFTVTLDPPLCTLYPALPQSDFEALKTCVASGRCPS